jgi:hypothetical protein
MNATVGATRTGNRPRDFVAPLAIVVVSLAIGVGAGWVLARGPP